MVGQQDNWNIWLVEELTQQIVNLKPSLEEAQRGEKILSDRSTVLQQRIRQLELEKEEVIDVALNDDRSKHPNGCPFPQEMNCGA